MTALIGVKLTVKNSYRGYMSLYNGRLAHLVGCSYVTKTISGYVFSNEKRQLTIMGI